MKALHWFSPLPPAQDERGRYARSVLPALAEHVRVVAWTEQEVVPLDLFKFADVRKLAPGPLDLAALSRVGEGPCVFHLGDDPALYRATWRLARSHPGLVVLHGSSFNALIRDQFRDEPALFPLWVEAAHGNAARRAAEDGEAAGPPLLGLVARGARAVMTHSPEVREAARWLVPCPVAFHPFPMEDPVSYAELLLTAAFNSSALHRDPGNALAPRVQALLDRVEQRVHAFASSAPTP